MIGRWRGGLAADVGHILRRLLGKQIAKEKK